MAGANACLVTDMYSIYGERSRGHIRKSSDGAEFSRYLQI